jgi:hypothetical protein
MTRKRKPIIDKSAKTGVRISLEDSLFGIYAEIRGDRNDALAKVRAAYADAQIDENNVIWSGGRIIGTAELQ